LEFLANLQYPVLADVEGIVVKEKLFHLRKHLECLLDFARHVVGRPHPPGMTGDRDRKSTRLNSSHGSISYAVFCLKKKNGHNTDYSYDNDSVSIGRVPDKGVHTNLAACDQHYLLNPREYSSVISPSLSSFKSNEYL